MAQKRLELRRTTLVLFLTAITENFKWNTIRAVILIVALGILLFGVYRLLTYPIM